MTTFEQALADAVQPVVDREIAIYVDALTEIAALHKISIVTGCCVRCGERGTCATLAIVDRTRSVAAS